MDNYFQHTDFQEALIERMVKYEVDRSVRDEFDPNMQAEREEIEVLWKLDRLEGVLETFELADHLSLPLTVKLIRHN